MFIVLVICKKGLLSPNLTIFCVLYKDFYSFHFRLYLKRLEQMNATVLILSLFTTNFWHNMLYSRYIPRTFKS